MDKTQDSKSVNKRRVVGKVISNSMSKSIVVQSHRRKLHPLYGKYIVISKKYMVHDETESAKCGDIVSISESKPISKKKHWKLQSVLKHVT